MDEEVNNLKEEEINNIQIRSSSLNPSSTSTPSFREIRKFLNEEENLLGKVERNNIIFNRKYVSNILDQNIRLYYTNIKSTDENVKIISNLCIVHGFGHYSQEFYELASFMAKNGMNCHLIDLRGHGLSGGCRFDWTVEDLHTDILTLIKQAEADGVDLPTFVFGHSMGGGLVTSLFINNQYLQVNGIILSAPLLGYPLNLTYDSLKFYVLSKVGNNLREFILNGNINPSELCKDERELIRILSDKRIIPFANPKSFRSLIKNCERILENSRYFNLPCLVIHGEKDKICSLTDSKFFVENVKHKVKELYVIKEGYHEIYLDFEKEEFMNKALTWILKTKNLGKTDKPFPIDIIIGPPRPIFNKIRISALFRIVLFILYFFIAYKIKPLIKSKLGRLFWPVSVLHYIYKNYLSMNYI